MPKESPFEGSNGQRRRQQIEDTRRRIAELDKVIGEVERINQRVRVMKAQLKRLEGGG